MTRDKVLEQALEALEDMVGGAIKVGDQWLRDTGEEELSDVTDNELAYLAIAAIKEELAKPAPEPVGPVECTYVEYNGTYCYAVWVDEYNPPTEGTMLYLAPLPPKVPEGWQLVPSEPTEEMVNMGCEVDLEEETPEDYFIYIQEIYKKMLAAAPQPGVPE